MSTPTPTHFGAWLKQRRNTLGLTQVQLAEQAHCSEMTIRKIEAGERKPSHAVAEALAHALQVPPPDQAAFIRFARGEADAPRLRPATPNNLPAEPNPLIGRDDLARTIAERLQAANAPRLITLLGPPGIGKTRLSLRVLSLLLNRFADGVYWVDLAPLPSSELVMAAIAHSIGATPHNRDLNTALYEHLREKDMLLMLDNFEHVLPAALSVAELLAKCPRLHLITTSRAPLNIRAERQWPVPPLDVHSSAITLFVDRAQAVQPDFTLNKANAEWVAAMCQQLDGLPLAIELVATQLPHLQFNTPPTQLLQIAGDGPHDLPPRQRTLHNAIAWSYHQLSQSEQQLFAALGIFVGGWDTAALTSITAIDNALQLVSGLVEKNLVVQQHPQRQRLLEVLREYAQVQQTPAMHAQLAHAHAHHYIQLAQTARPHFEGAEQVEWLAGMDQDWPNCRAALQYALAQDVALAAQGALALARLWQLKGYFDEGDAIYQQLLAHTGFAALDAVTQADVINAAGALAMMRQDNPRAIGYYQRGLALARRENDPRSITVALINLGQLCIEEHDLPNATTYLNEALSSAQQQNDARFTAYALGALGRLAEDQSDPAQAEAHLERALAMHRQLNDRYSSGHTLFNLSGLARRMAAPLRAVHYAQEALIIFEQLQSNQAVGATLLILAHAQILLGDANAIAAAHAGLRRALPMVQQLGLIDDCIEGLLLAAYVAMAEELDERAAQLLGAHQALRTGDPSQRNPAEREQERVCETMLRRRLGPAKYKHALAAGRSLQVAEGIALAAG